LQLKENSNFEMQNKQLEEDSEARYKDIALQLEKKENVLNKLRAVISRLQVCSNRQEKKI